MLNQSDQDKVRVRVSLAVDFTANGASPESLAKRVKGVFERAMEDWGLEGDSGAVVDQTAFQAVAFPPEAAKLDELNIANWISRRIEDGDLDLDDIPRLMARYALADPSTLLIELAERIQQADEDQIEEDEDEDEDTAPSEHISPGEFEVHQPSPAP